MQEESDRVESIVLAKRVKLHIFEPSKRMIWSVVGKSKEHWLDPDSEFCSCPGYYFGRLNGRESCYHLESLKLAQKSGKVDVVKFSDDEFLSFIKGLISEF